MSGCVTNCSTRFPALTKFTDVAFSKAEMEEKKLACGNRRAECLRAGLIFIPVTIFSPLIAIAGSIRFYTTQSLPGAMEWKILDGLSCTILAVPYSTYKTMQIFWGVIDPDCAIKVINNQPEDNYPGGDDFKNGHIVDIKELDNLVYQESYEE